jgi:hypothetical protein
MDELHKSDLRSKEMFFIGQKAGNGSWGVFYGNSLCNQTNGKISTKIIDQQKY